MKPILLSKFALLLVAIAMFHVKSFSQTRIANIVLEPIQYQSPPHIASNVHAYFTFEILPGNELEYLNVRLTDPGSGITAWSVQNLPLFPSEEPEVISYVINVEDFGSTYAALTCGYNTGQWFTENNFPSSETTDLVPQPTVYNIPTGSTDQPILLLSAPKGAPVGSAPAPKAAQEVNRDKDMPNVDLDQSKDKTDYNACGPAAAANSLEWLKSQHEELKGDETTLRSKLDSLKKFMNRGDAKGVRFDSMVVGKLTLIDQLKLPINVKYKTKHESGNTDEPLSSTKPPYHTADNKGKLNEHPDFDFLKAEMDAGEDVEVQVGWYGPPDKKGNRERLGGHWMVVSGYKENGKEQGITIKDDDDQAKKGGLRTKYFKWKKLPKTKQPYLEELKDKKGNIAIVESVVSESYDPTVTFEERVQIEATDPWDKISLTETNMKPFYTPVVAAHSSSAFIPIVAGIVGAGALIYVLVDKKDEPADCSFSAGIQSTHASCGLANGSVTINVNVEATYQWSNGATIQNLTDIPAGIYSVTVTRIGTTCSQVLQTNVMDINTEINTEVIIGDAHCGLNDGSAIPFVSPPGIYSYLWSNGSTDEIQDHLAAGNYTLTVTLSGTCQDITSVNIDELPPVFTLTSLSSAAACGLADGSATVEVDLPGQYIYAWSNGQNTSQLSNVTAGMYEVTVTTEGTACSKSISVTIDELPPAFTITSTTTPAGCGLADGTAAAAVDPPGSYQYQWSNGQSTQQASGLIAGTYSVTVTQQGAPQCTKSIDVTVDQLPPSFTLTVSTNPANCGFSDGNATVSADPPGVYEYLWSNGQMTQQATGFTPGTYTVTVTQTGTPCFQTMDFIIGELPPAYTLSVSTTATGCGVNNGTATVTVDPPNEYVIQWSNGQIGPLATGLAQGQYSVSVTQAGSSCVVVDSVVIQQVSVSFTAGFSVVNADCGIANGAATISIDPPGNYSFLWSDGQTGPVLQNVLPGSYSITVTDENLCTASFSALIPSNPVDYIDIIGIMSANCTGGGEINISLMTPGNGPMQVVVNGPEGMNTWTLAEGTYSVSSLINVLPGTYSFHVIDEGIGGSCNEIQTVTILDNTPPLVPADDSYATIVGQVVSGNMLNNDTGLSLQVTMISDETGGTATFTSGGDFIFTPSPGFSGIASFIYTVTDMCGNSGTALVTIDVQMVACDFTISTTTIPAHCDLSDGYINVEVNEPGNYSFQWDNGETGPELIDIVSGLYLVTITDNDLGCSLEFEIELEEYPAEYFEIVEVVQPTCSTPGSIQIEVTAPGQDDELTMLIFHPNGSDEFIIGPGTIDLSDYIDITPGEYTIEIYIGNVGSGCIDQVTVTLDNPPMLVIEEDAVFPPSSPSAEDGSARIIAVVPGTLPYTVFVDGLPVATAISHIFLVGGMGVGLHTIQIQDANGCFSNTITVDIPFPDIIFSFGVMLTPLSVIAADDEHIHTLPEDAITTAFVATLKYYTGNIKQQFHFQYVPPTRLGNHQLSESFQAEHRTAIVSMVNKQIQFNLYGGVGVAFGRSSFHSDEQAFLSLTSSMGFDIGKFLHVQSELGVRGGHKRISPTWGIMLSTPFYSWEY